MGTFRLPQAMMLTPTSLAAPLLAVLRPGRQKYRDGLPPALLEWIHELERLADEPPAVTPAAQVVWIDLEQAAVVLGLSVRQARTLAPRMDGRKIAGRWMVNAYAIADEAEARTAAVGRREVASVA